jgi:hydrogenase/urease accessory protein HupE
VSTARSRATFAGCLWLVLIAATAWASIAEAHEVRPAFLEIRESSAGTFDVLWKVPARGEYRLSLHARLPAECSGSPTHGNFVADAFVEQWQARCPDGLVGREISIEGLSATRTDVLARLERADGTTQTVRLTPEQTSFVVQAAPSALEVSKTYFVLGVEHILLGVDHLLFVLGLLLIVRDRWMLVKTVTAFTTAHSITLAVATFGVATVAAGPLNAAIALSILFLGPEIVRVWRGETSFTIRHPWVVAFAFGLLHGFGFASGLAQLGLPKGEIPLALLLFNVGVEIGQLVFVIVVLLLERAFRLLALHWPTMVARLPGYVVGTLGAFWTIQRVAILLRGLA